MARMNSFALFFVVCSYVFIVKAETVRQCSCDEFHKCEADLEKIAEGCMEGCYGELKSITSKPKDVGQCFKNKHTVIMGFIDCFVDGMGGCAANTNGPQIPKQDIESIITAVEDQIRKHADKMLNDFGAENKATVQPVVDAAEKFDACAKTCIRQKIGNTFCLATYKCQPQLPDATKSKQLIQSCTAKGNLKQHAGDVCECALNAGVRQLQTFCPVLKLMENGPGALPPPPFPPRSK